MKASIAKIVAILFFILMLVSMLNIYGTTGVRWSDILIIAFCTFVLPSGLYFWLTGTDPQSQLKREIDFLVEKNSNKAPVLYLRSFASETIKMSDIKTGFFGRTIPGTPATWKAVGNTVTSFLEVIGPVKAFAPPTTSWGIRRWEWRPKYVAVANDQWKQQILEWLPKAALVVVQMDASPGLTWELQQLTSHVHPTKLLLVLPSIQGEYDSIRAEAHSFFPKSLPTELPASRLMTFRPDWEPWPLIAGEGICAAWLTLEPIFKQNGYQSPLQFSL